MPDNSKAKKNICPIENDSPKMTPVTYVPTVPIPTKTVYAAAIGIFIRADQHQKADGNQKENTNPIKERIRMLQGGRPNYF